MKAEEGLAAEGDASKAAGALPDTTQAGASQGACSVALRTHINNRPCGSPELTPSPSCMRSWRRGTGGGRCCL